MPNVMHVLKAEIVRLARKEAKAATQKLRREAVALKRRGAEQKRRLAALERLVKKMRVLAKDQLAKVAEPTEQELRAARLSSAMVKRVRTKLGLSQTQLAKLVGVSPISVYMWERKGGRLQLRSATRAAFIAVRKLGKREVRARLEGLVGAVKAKLSGRAKTKPAAKRAARKPRRQTKK